MVFTCDNVGTGAGRSVAPLFRAVRLECEASASPSRGIWSAKLQLRFYEAPPSTDQALQRASQSDGPAAAPSPLRGRGAGVRGEQLKSLPPRPLILHPSHFPLSPPGERGRGEGRTIEVPSAPSPHPSSFIPPPSPSGAPVWPRSSAPPRPTHPRGRPGVGHRPSASARLPERAPGRPRSAGLRPAYSGGAPARLLPSTTDPFLRRWVPRQWVPRTGPPPTALPLFRKIRDCPCSQALSANVRVADLPRRKMATHIPTCARGEG